MAMHVVAVGIVRSGRSQGHVLGLERRRDIDEQPRSGEIDRPAAILGDDAAIVADLDPAGRVGEPDHGGPKLREARPEPFGLGVIADPGADALKILARDEEDDVVGVAECGHDPSCSGLEQYPIRLNSVVQSDRMKLL
ncbi:MAG: hypothetical protein WD673_14190 [Alphaproteobacteria bacterium]